MGDNLGGNVAAGPVRGDMNAGYIAEGSADIRGNPRRDAAAWPDFTRGVGARPPGISGNMIGGSNIGGNVALGGVQGSMIAAFRSGGVTTPEEKKPQKGWSMRLKIWRPKNF